MNRLYAFILCLMLAVPAYARIDIDTSNLTDAQKAELAMQAAKMASEANKPAELIKSAVNAPDKVNEWVGIGSRIGQALGGAAKEIGVAVNDFAKSPVGQLTMALIVWKMMGGAIVHVIGGLLVMGIGLSFVMYMFNRTYPKQCEYDTSKTNLFGNYPIR